MLFVSKQLRDVISWWYVQIDRYLMFYVQSTAKGHVRAKCIATTSKIMIQCYDTFHYWLIKMFYETNTLLHKI